ncbi:MAG: hypothetical protein ABMA25_16555 [Ilumatobacteraceae bacterium]
MKRRLALTAGALVAALSFSSCSTFDHSDVAATVNGHELTRDQLDTLVEDQLVALAATRATLEPGALDTTAKEIDIYREALTGWVQLVLMEGASYQGVPADAAASTTRQQAAFASLVREPSDGQWLYEVGAARTQVACLSVIVTQDPLGAEQAAAALADGAPFEEVFPLYNQNESVAATGGVLSTDGSDCATIDALAALGIPAAAITDLGIGHSSGSLEVTGQEGLFVVIRHREWSEVSPEWQDIFTGGSVPASAREGDVSVASRFGTWDPATLTVEPAAAG